MNDERTIPTASRRPQARRLLRLEHERRAALAELEAAGCTFRGRVERQHRLLSHELDRIEAAFQAEWQVAA